MSLYHKILQGRPNQFESKKDNKRTFCNAVLDLHKIYVGKDSYMTGYDNPAENIAVLEEGASNNCFMAMEQLSVYIYLGQGIDRDLVRAYSLARTAYNYLVEENIFRPSLLHLLAAISLETNDIYQSF